MARRSKHEKTILTPNGDHHPKSSSTNGTRKGQNSEEVNIEEMLQQLKRARLHRHASIETYAIPINTSTFSRQQSYQQLAERVRELENEIVPDLHFYSAPPVFSPFSVPTPCSNVSASGFSTFSHSQNFPMSLLSPNSSVSIQRFGLSSKILERAHQIPERFWVDWQEKQMQTRIEELEYIKNNLTSPNDIDPQATGRRKSLLLLHDLQRRMSLPRSTTLKTIVSASVDTEPLSTISPNIDGHSLFNFDQRSIDRVDATNLNNLSTHSSQEPTTPKSPSTLDRSRLTIPLPLSNTNLPKSPVSSVGKEMNLISSASSIEDIAQIDTELKLILLSQENSTRTNPLLYSGATINQTIEFRSSSLSTKHSFNQSEQRITPRSTPSI